MVVASLVESARSEKLKKHLSIPEEDEYQCSSGPLNDFVLWSVLAAMPSQVALSKRRSRPLKRGYIADLVREGGVSPCCVLLGLIYIQRLANTNPSYMATLSPRQLFLIAMVIASKYLNDEGEMEALTNSEWAAIGAVPKPNLDTLEQNFLKAMDWKLYVPLDEFYSFVSSVEGRVALQQAMSRGWLSYTDLVAIWNTSDTYTSMLQYTTKVAFTGATLYLMCVSTLLAAAHSLYSDSATPSGPLFSSPPSPSAPSSSLPGHPLDNSTSHIWPIPSTSAASNSTRARAHTGSDVLDARLLLGSVAFPDPPALTRSLVQPHSGQESLLRRYSNCSCRSPSKTLNSFVTNTINFSLGTDFLALNYLLQLKAIWQCARKETLQKQSAMEHCKFRLANHTHNPLYLTPGEIYKRGNRDQSPASVSPYGSVARATVQVPQALELGYSHKGTFHWDPLVNTSSWPEQRNRLSGSFGVIAEYFMSS